MKLLIVDDETPICTIVTRIARQRGWDAINTTNPRGLSELIRAEKVDLLMIDFILENLASDVTAALIVKGLRGEGIDIPVVMFSGASHLIEREEAQALGVVAILDKPISLSELDACLNSIKSGQLVALPSDSAATP